MIKKAFARAGGAFPASDQPSLRIITLPHAPEPQKPKLLDRVRQAIRTRHLSPHTEQAYIGWIKRFIFFHGKRHPVEMGEPETQPIFHFPFEIICDLSLKPPLLDWPISL